MTSALPNSSTTAACVNDPKMFKLHEKQREESHPLIFEQDNSHPSAQQCALQQARLQVLCLTLGNGTCKRIPRTVAHMGQSDVSCFIVSILLGWILITGCQQTEVIGASEFEPSDPSWISTLRSFASSFSLLPSCQH